MAAGRNEPLNFFGICVHHFRCRARSKSNITIFAKSKNPKIAKFEKSINRNRKTSNLAAANEFFANMSAAILPTSKRRDDHEAIGRSMPVESVYFFPLSRPPQ